MFSFTCRMLQSGKYASTKFTHRPKIRFFAPQGRLVAPIHVKFGMTKEHMGPLGHTKFHANRSTGVGMRPQNIQNFHFLVKHRLAGANPLTNFLQVLYAQPSYISVLNLTLFASQVTELLLRNCVSVIKAKFFRAPVLHPVGKTMCWIIK